MPTKQETFDTVVAHLRKQGRKSVEPLPVPKSGSRCVYRADNGDMCAAGCLIPNDKYATYMEGFAIDEDGDSVGPVLAQLGYDVDLVRELQTIHDAYSPVDWEREFEYTANSRKLTYTPRA